VPGEMPFSPKQHPFPSRFSCAILKKGLFYHVVSGFGPEDPASDL
jgi:hypothetical protein